MNNALLCFKEVWSLDLGLRQSSLMSRTVLTDKANKVVVVQSDFVEGFSVVVRRIKSSSYSYVADQACSCFVLLVNA